MERSAPKHLRPSMTTASTLHVGVRQWAGNELWKIKTLFFTGHDNAEP